MKKVLQTVRGHVCSIPKQKKRQYFFIPFDSSAIVGVSRTVAGLIDKLAEEYQEYVEPDMTYPCIRQKGEIWIVSRGPFKNQDTEFTSMSEAMTKIQELCA